MPIFGAIANAVVGPVVNGLINGGSSGGGTAQQPTGTTVNANPTTNINATQPYTSNNLGQSLSTSAGIGGAVLAGEQATTLQNTGNQVAASENTFGNTQGTYQNLLQQLLTNSGFVTSSPLYQAEVNSSIPVVQSSLAAQGLTASGNQINALQTQNEDIVGNIFNQYASILPSLATYGSSPTAAGTTTMNALIGAQNLQGAALVQATPTASALGGTLSSYLNSIVGSGAGNNIPSAVGSLSNSFSQTTSNGSYDPITGSYTTTSGYNPIPGTIDQSSVPLAYNPATTPDTSGSTPLGYDASTVLNTADSSGALYANTSMSSTPSYDLSSFGLQ